MTYTHDITLDLNPKYSAYPIVEAKQNDIDSRVINVHYTQDGEPYNVSTNSSVALRLRKPDKHIIFNDATINDDGTVSVTLTQQCLASAGRAYADLVEFDTDGKTLSTVSFIINISPIPNVMGSQALSSDEFLYLMSFINQGNHIIGEAQEWANGYNGSQALGPSSNISVPGNNNNAKYWSEQAEISRQKNENMTASAVQLQPDTQPKVTKTVQDGIVNLEFGIPKSNAAYVTFDIDYTNGNLYMFRPDSGQLTDELKFNVNNNGMLEIIFEEA